MKNSLKHTKKSESFESNSVIKLNFMGLALSIPEESSGYILYIDN